MITRVEIHFHPFPFRNHDVSAQTVLGYAFWLTSSTPSARCVCPRAEATSAYFRHLSSKKNYGGVPARYPKRHLVPMFLNQNVEFYSCNGVTIPAYPQGLPLTHIGHGSVVLHISTKSLLDSGRWAW